MSLLSPIVVQDPEVGRRIDLVCAHAYGLPRSQVSQLIKTGGIRVNQHIVKPAYSVQIGDLIAMESDLTSVKPNLPFPEDWVPEVVAEDESIVVINKPAGVIVHPGHPSVNTHYLTDWLVARDPKIGLVGSAGRPGIVHRLDQFTEGLMVVAKTESALEHLKAQFKARTVEKAYYAMVRGNVLSDDLYIDQPIARHTRKRRRMGIVPDGKPAQSLVHVIERFQTKTLVRVVPKTGRTHQIRVHLEFVQHPVMGDPLYGPSSADRSGQRLQSYFLAFDHPQTGERCRFELPIAPRIMG